MTIPTDSFEAKAGDSLRNTIADIVIGIRSTRTALFLALWDIRLRYRRSVLGPLWLSITSLAFIVGYYAVGSLILSSGRSNYLIFVAAGVIYWQFIVGTFVEASNLFATRRAELLSEAANKTVFIIRLFAKQLIVLAHQLPILILVWLIFAEPSWSVLFTIVSVPIFVLASTGPVVILAVMGARFRDIPEFLGLFFQLFFFLTPVIWDPALAAGSTYGKWLLNLNPFFHLMEILREPLLGKLPPLTSLLAAGGMGIVSALVGFAMFAKFRHRIVYWL